MKNHREKNVRIKRKYLLWLREARGLSIASVDRAAASIDRYRTQTKDADLGALHSEKARAFKRWLRTQKNSKTGQALSAGSVDGTLRDLKAYFSWLADQPGYRSKVSHAEAAWFSPDRRTAKAAHGGCWVPHPTPEQVEHALRSMPSETLIERRDRAIFACLYLTGVRDGSLITLRLGNVVLQNDLINLQGPEIQTKFGKVFTVTFFPVARFVREVFADWVRELQCDRLFGQADPVFPKQLIAIGAEGGFIGGDLAREPYASAARVVKVVRAAFEVSGLPPFTPHLLRKTLVDLANRHCRTPEEFKAWSQNLGHDSVDITFRSYGAVAPGRQREVLLSMISDDQDDLDVIEKD